MACAYDIDTDAYDCQIADADRYGYSRTVTRLRRAKAIQVTETCLMVSG